MELSANKYLGYLYFIHTNRARRVKMYCFAALLGISLLSFKQDNKEELEWRSDRKLKWEDFKSLPDAHSKASAEVLCTVKVDYRSKQDTLFVVVKAIMKQSESWYNRKYKVPASLQHEQIHFDIAEIYARTLRSKITVLKTKKSKVSDELDVLIKLNGQELNTFQDMYDNETNHGRNKKKQLEWEKIVAADLKAYSLYKNTEVKILLVKE